MAIIDYNEDQALYEITIHKHEADTPALLGKVMHYIASEISDKFTKENYGKIVSSLDMAEIKGLTQIEIAKKLAEKHVDN